MSTLPTPSRIVIVGGGLAGTLVAVQLLRRAAPGTLITLVERRPPVGRGVAYSTQADVHLLNVPVERMGAFPDDPGHFLRWVGERTGRPGFPAAVTHGDFLPRRLYGDYIGYVLTEARQQADPTISFTVRTGEVVDLDELSGGSAARVYFADGSTLVADHVVMAIGNLPGEYPCKSGRAVYRGRRYVHVPWNADAIEGIAPDSTVLIAGQGLTAVDIILQLVEGGHRGEILCLSRRGRPLLAHREHARYPDFLSTEEAPRTIRALVRRIRAEVAKAARAGYDWRGVIDALRPHSARLWAALDWSERARFLRHVRPYWEIHRHRLAPGVAACIDELALNGRVRFLAGRFRHLEETADGLCVTWRPRGGDEDSTLQVSKLINCTGPRTDYSKYQHPLLINLLARGLIDHDPLALGIAATHDGRVQRYRGSAIPWLHTLGAPLKGMRWESTAAPEIRAQAATLVGNILSDSAMSASAPLTRFQRLIADTKSRIAELSVETLAAELDLDPKPVLIDVREDDEFAKGAIPGAIHLSRGILEGNIEKAVPDTSADIVLYCAGGNRSALSADNLQKMGYTKVRSLIGGFGAWSKFKTDAAPKS